MYKKILLAYDFGNTFDNVPQELQNLTAGVDDAEITIFNVISEGDLQTSVRISERKRQKTRSICSKIRKSRFKCSREI